MNSNPLTTLSEPKQKRRGELNDVWRDFVKNLPPEQVEAMRRNGLNPDDINDDGLHRFHRLVEPDETGDGDGVTYWSLIMGRHQRKMLSERKPDADPLEDFATAVAARVIDAFDCSRDPRVRFHADCMRIALGYKEHGSLEKVAKRYDTDKQKVHWHVTTIRKRLGL